VTPAALLDPEKGRPLWQDGVFFAAMVGILVFASWSKPGDGDGGAWAAIHSLKWGLTGVFAVVVAGSVAAWFRKDEVASWVDTSWTFAKQILPLLLGGVLVAGFLLGGPGGSERGLVPGLWIEQSVGGNSLASNLFAAVLGAFMYFATLTEVPIVAGLLESGMGPGPALALLLAGPALSLPSMLVIRSVMGTKKTIVFVALVIVLSTAAGLVYGQLFEGHTGRSAPAPLTSKEAGT
jgi:uncharacterized membrane protein YraQ (UPF0718 family)